MRRETLSLGSRRIRNAGWRIAIVAMVASISNVTAADNKLRVMTYNIWLGGTAINQPLSRTVGVIQAAQADVVGLQEQGGSGPAIAAALGFNYYDLGGSTAILSRYPIVQGSNEGVKLRQSPNREFYIFDVHLTAYPYQPYDIQSGLITTESQAIAAAQQTRSASSVLNDMSSALASGKPVFLTGDFNEPSHLDWTHEAATAGLNFGMKVNWPTSRSVTNAGLIDAFRQLRPDEVMDRGETWTPGYPPPNVDSNEVHDRIDFVYYKGTNVTPISAQTLGYDANDGNTDIAIQPYPSDHRAMVVEFEMPFCVGLGDINSDCATNSADWVQFRTWQHSNMMGLTPTQAWERGDINGDFQNNHADFVLFKSAYENEHGAGSFVAMLSAIPEPSSFVFEAWAVFLCLAVARRR